MNNRFASLRKSTEQLCHQGRQLILRHDYLAAEAIFERALESWRRSSAPREEEAAIVISLGKCYEAQHKYEQAYELYMESLKHLKGSAYDDVYTSFVYLNERMGAFRKPGPEDF
jgi:tetratricopeptide (TPR) repeat protein